MFWQIYWWPLLLAILTVPLLCVLVFGLWLRRQPDMTWDVGVKSWDVFIKLISTLTVVVTGAMLFGKYIDQQAQAEAARTAQASKDAEQVLRDNALREADFLTKKVVIDTERHERHRALLSEARTVAVRIASTETPSGPDTLRFDELYYADLIGVEGASVRGAMIDFRSKLYEPSSRPASLRQLALALSNAVRRELEDSEKALLEQHRAISELLKTAPGG
jgi:hypothetical protein